CRGMEDFQQYSGRRENPPRGPPRLKRPVFGRIVHFRPALGPKLGKNRAHARARLPTSSSGPWVARRSGQAIPRNPARHCATVCRATLFFLASRASGRSFLRTELQEQKAIPGVSGSWFLPSLLLSVGPSVWERLWASASPSRERSWP